MRFIAAFLLAPLLLTCSPLAFAADAAPVRPANLRVNMQNDTPSVGDFIVGPARIFLTIPAGQERTVELQVTNRVGSLADFTLTEEDFDSDPQREGTPVFYANDQQGMYPARAWLKPEVDRMQLRHGERAFINVTVKVPVTADPGDHQAAVVVTHVMSSGNNGGLSIVSRVAALFIITVPGDIVQQGSITGLQPQNYLNWFFPVNLYLSAHNTGTVHMDPIGTITIRNVFGISVDDIPVKDWFILRNSSRQRNFAWQPLFALGYYRATTNLVAFGNKQLDPVSAGFWVVPLLPVLILLFLIVLVSFLVQYFSARFEITRKPRKKK